MRSCARGLLHLASVIGILIGPFSGARADETITYTYDALGRLVTVVSTGSVNNGVQTTYQQDAADNRTRVVVTGSTTPPPP